MIKLIWAWRVWFGQISMEDVPEIIRRDVEKIVETLRREKGEPQ